MCVRKQRKGGKERGRKGGAKGEKEGEEENDKERGRGRERVKGEHRFQFPLIPAMFQPVVLLSLTDLE